MGILYWVWGVSNSVGILNKTQVLAGTVDLYSFLYCPEMPRRYPVSDLVGKLLDRSEP